MMKNNSEELEPMNVLTSLSPSERDRIIDNMRIKMGYKPEPDISPFGIVKASNYIKKPNS